MSPEYKKANEQIIIADYGRLQNITEEWWNTEKELDDISR